MYKFKKGDRVIVVNEWEPWVKQNYALNGWTGTIKDTGIFGDEYTIRWDLSCTGYKHGDLIKTNMIKLIDKPKPKEYGIVKFMKGEMNKCQIGVTTS